METTAIIALGAVSASAASAIGTAIFSLRKNNAGIASDVISTQKERIKQLEDRVTTCEGLHRINLDELGKVKGAMISMENILKDRNPETLKFMEYMTQVAQRSDSYMNAYAAVPQVLEEMRKSLSDINDHLSPPRKKKRIT